MSESTAPKQVRRRTIAKGAAWTVPAIAVAGAAPAMAQSLPPVHIDFSAGACKLPGNSWDNGPNGPFYFNKGYVLWATFINTTTSIVSVRVNAISVGGIDQCLVGMAGLACGEIQAGGGPTMDIVDCITLDPGEQRTIGVFSNAADESSSNDVIVDFTWYETGDGACGTGVPHPEEQTANVTGESWSGPGSGSCQQPAGTCARPPIVPLSCRV